MIHRRGQTYSIALQDDAKRDLDALYEIAEDAAADIEVFLEEAKHNQYTLENLTRHGYVQYDDPAYSVKEWQKARKQRLNLWRLRLMWLEGTASDYRIVYAFHPVQFRYYVLGIVHRKKLDYDNFNSPICQRIISAYDDLDIPSY